MSSPAFAYSNNELAMRLRQQELVAAFGVFAMQAEGLNAVLDEASAVAAQGLGSRFAKVLQWLPGEMEFVVRSGVGWHAGVVGHARIGGDLQSPAGFAFRTGEAVVSNHLTNEHRFRTPALLAEHGVRSAINVLVHAPGAEPFGVLEGDSTDRHDFGDHDVAFLKSLANTLAVAVQTQQRQEVRDQLIAEKDQLLREKDLLMQEVHHRVTNSLQLVRTLLMLQRLPAHEPARDSLEEAAGRIMTIGTVHRRLYQGASVTSADAAAYLRGLLDDMQAMLAEAHGGRVLDLRMAPLQLAADQLTPLGLVTSELVTNALKHARGRVLVEVERVEGGLEVAVSDEGPGFAADFTPGGSRGLGMRLVAALAKAGDASIRIDRSVSYGRIIARLATAAA